MEKSLKERVALVTGSSRGIGKEIAITLGRAGAKVAICARNSKELKAATATLEALEIECIAVLVDLEKPASAGFTLGKVARKWGRLDILVNNVGGLSRMGRFESLNDKDWLSAFQLNLMPTVRFCRKAIPYLKDSPYPRIINLSSMVASQPGSFNPHYSCFKAAILNLTKHLSGVCANDGILVNSISPGIIHTEGWDHYISSKSKEMGISLAKCSRIETRRASENVPLKRLGTVQEVADLVAFLASDKASFITGSNHRIDGGRVQSI